MFVQDEPDSEGFNRLIDFWQIVFISQFFTHLSIFFRILKFTSGDILVINHHAFVYLIEQDSRK